MNSRMILMVLALTLSLVGCSTSMHVETGYQPMAGEKFKYRIMPVAEVSTEALVLLRQRLDAQLSANGQLAFGSDESANSVEVTITAYRMRHGAARAMAGIFAGTDSMISTVEVKEPKTQSVKAKFDVLSSNATAWGTSQGMIEDHADQIVQYLKTGRAK